MIEEQKTVKKINYEIRIIEDEIQTTTNYLNQSLQCVVKQATAGIENLARGKWADNHLFIMGNAEDVSRYYERLKNLYDKKKILQWLLK